MGMFCVLGDRFEWKEMGCKQSHSVLDFLIQFWTPGPVGAVFAAYSPRCDVHRGVLTQMRSAFLTAPDPEKRTRNSIIS